MDKNIEHKKDAADYIDDHINDDENKGELTIDQVEALLEIKEAYLRCEKTDLQAKNDILNVLYLK